MLRLAALNDRRVVTLVSAAAILLVYTAVLVTALVPANFNPLALARLSRQYPSERFWDQSPLVEDGDGYDGQFFYYIARDPLLLEVERTTFDVLHYRYQRILLPALAHVLALGQPAAIGWALVAVNLLALAVGCAFAARLLDAFGATRWWLVPYALNPGFVLGIRMDLAEPLALALCTVACYWYLKQKPLAAVVALALAGLSRESVLVVALGFVAYELLMRRAVVRAGLFLLPFVVLVCWQVVVLLRVGDAPWSVGASHLGIAPISAIARIQALAMPDATLLQLSPAQRVAEATAIAAVIVASALAIVGGLRQRSWLGWQLALQGAFMLSLNYRVWDQSLGFARAAILLWMFYLLVVVERRSARNGFSPTCSATEPMPRKR